MNNVKEKNGLMFNTLIISVLLGLILALFSIILEASELLVGVVFFTPALLGFFLCLVVEYVNMTIKLNK